MGSEIQLLPDLLHFFAAQAAPPIITVPDVSSDSSHPLSSKLREQLAAIDERTIETAISDPESEFHHFHAISPDLAKHAREWHVIKLLDRQIPRLRRKLLIEQNSCDRPPPYDHPALADLPIAEDCLVPIREFEFYRGSLVRSGFAFSIVPVTESINSSYWLTRTLMATLRDSVTVRLDPLLACPVEDYAGLEYKMLVYGRELHWDRLVCLTEDEHVQWQPGPLTKGVYKTDLVWSARPYEVHFQCEELLASDRISGWGCRYLHAIFDRSSRRISHFDGALRFMTNDDLGSRQRCHLRHAKKVGTRVKVFRSDIPVDPERFAQATPQFFIWNYDVARYFGNDIPPGL